MSLIKEYSGTQAAPQLIEQQAPLTYIEQLMVSGVRNLTVQTMQLGPGMNVVFGSNASGKTSLLEAIHLLSLGRSFRAKSIQPVINFATDSCVIRAQVCTTQQSAVWLGLEKHLNAAARYKVGENPANSITELSRLLPIQLIDSSSYLLLEGGPLYRRQFIDWGVFHVEHSFYAVWQRMQRALGQRNAALKQRTGADEMWGQTFVEYAQLVDAARRRYLAGFIEVLNRLLSEVLGWSMVTADYSSGWGEGEDLLAVLRRSRAMDLAYGYTTHGPHRAELELRMGGRPLKQVLSRGQAKMLVCMMLLARAHHLLDIQRSIFLVDDLLSELDIDNSAILLDSLANLGGQVLITGTDAEKLRGLLAPYCVKMFHVEHGQVREYTRS